MISMYTKQEIIIRSHVEGKSQRQISRELQLSRKTVKKYIEDYESSFQKGFSQSFSRSNYLSAPPIYRTGHRSRLKLTQEVQFAIDKLVELNAQKRQQGLRKQLLKKKDILDELHQQGFNIGYTTVCNYISQKERRPQNKEAFIRQDYRPGEVCEFDWGEIKLYLDGKLARLQLAVFTSAYSNYRYAFIYHRQDTLSFMESHVRFFDAINGVYPQMVYDNMRVAVSRFIGPHEKEPTRALLQLRGHYSFSHRFCNAYRGNEKGHVERSVEYIRRKAFGLKDRFSDIAQAGSHLLSTLNKLNGTKQTGTGQTASDLFQEEKKVLRSLPPSGLVCSEQVQLRADKYATISYRTCRYSVPDSLVGQFVDVDIQSHGINIYHQSKQVATHKRNFEKHQWVIDIEHYLSTFKQKPGALPGSLALASNVYLRGLYHQHFYNDSRNFIDLLAYCRDNKVSNEKLEESVKRLLASGNGKLTAEKLCALLGNNETIEKQPEADNISLLAKQQLSELTTLMNQNN